MVSLTESINPSPSPDTLSILTMHPTFLMSDVSDHIPTIGSYLNCLIRLDHCQPDDFPDMVTDTRRTKVCPLEKYWSAAESGCTEASTRQEIEGSKITESDVPWD